jgi:hypothetical protein
MSPLLALVLIYFGGLILTMALLLRRDGIKRFR